MIPVRSRQNGKKKSLRNLNEIISPTYDRNPRSRMPVKISSSKLVILVCVSLIDIELCVFFLPNENWH